MTLSMLGLFLRYLKLFEWKNSLKQIRGNHSVSCNVICECLRILYDILKNIYDKIILTLDNKKHEI